jgi:hypothetical protein
MHTGFTGQSADDFEPPSVEWVPVESHEHGNVFIKAVVNQKGREPFNDDWQEEYTVATAWDMSEGDNPDWKHEQRANARLLAAAPYMFHALKCASEEVGDWRGLIDLALEQAENAEIINYDDPPEA